MTFAPFNFSKKMVYNKEVLDRPRSSESLVLALARPKKIRKFWMEVKLNCSMLYASVIVYGN